MEKRYTVLIVGMGKRGKHHAAAFFNNPRFQVVGLCDIDRSRAEAFAPLVGNPQAGTDAEEMAMSLRPDIFCFCTLPNIRLQMVKIAVKCGAKLLAFEKPVALSSAEAMKIRDLLKKKNIKAVVSHQHRYGAHYQKVKEIAASGALGRIHTITATATGWFMHMMSHLISYMRWYNDYAEAVWAMAQAAGRGKLADVHSSPDYLAGVIQFANGVRGYVETGGGAPDQPEVEKWWGKNKISVYGTEGFAEVLTNGGWRAITKSGGFQSGPGAMNYDLDMPPYIQDMAEWLDDETKPHPCRFEDAYKGAEIMAALLRSAAEGGQVALPLEKGKNELRVLAARLPGRKVMVSSPVNASEYGV